MSNSPLVSYTKISPNSTNPRKSTIKKITIHHMAGNLTVETCGNVFAPTSRQASSNYGIGTDGRVGMYVEEKNRAWTSSNADNDSQAVTIEVANDVVGGNWHVSDVALNKLIDLCVDICKRNGIPALNFTGNKNGNLTMHKWFAATACPGPYLESKFPYIASEVNKKLNTASPSVPTPTPAPTNPTTGCKVGDIVNFSGGPVYSSANAATAAHTRNASRCKVTQVYNGKHPYHCISEDGKGVYGWVDAANVGAASASSPKIAVGSTVRITGDKYATGQGIPGWVKKSTHTVSQINGSKALLGANGGICSWVNLADLTLA